MGPAQAITTMPARCYDLHGVRILECDAGGAPVQTERDVLDLIAAAASNAAGLIVIPAARLGEAFFRLKTRVAGEVLQKFLTYGLRVAIVGDISSHVGESTALRDFVYECNRGSQIWFVADTAELVEWLERQAKL